MIIEDKLHSEIERFESEQSKVEYPEVGVYSTFTSRKNMPDDKSDSMESNYMSGPKLK